jgi:hypothetical protein
VEQELRGSIYVQNQRQCPKVTRHGFTATPEASLSFP